MPQTIAPMIKRGTNDSFPNQDLGAQPNARVPDLYCAVAVAEAAFKNGLTRRMRRHIYRVISDSLTVCFVCPQHNTLASMDRNTHCRIDNRQLQNYSPIATGVASGDYR